MVLFKLLLREWWGLVGGFDVLLLVFMIGVLAFMCYAVFGVCSIGRLVCSVGFCFVVIVIDLLVGFIVRGDIVVSWVCLFGSV